MVKESFITQSTQGNTKYTRNRRSYFTYNLTLLNGKRKFYSTKYTNATQSTQRITALTLLTTLYCLMVKENFVAQSATENTKYTTNHYSYFTYTLTLLNDKRKFCRTKYTREHNVLNESLILLYLLSYIS